MILNTLNIYLGLFQYYEIVLVSLGCDGLLDVLHIIAFIFKKQDSM